MRPNRRLLFDWDVLRIARLLLALVAVAGAKAQAPTTQPVADKPDDALIRRLRDAGDGGDIQTRITRLMERSQERLERAFDPGPSTQQIQAKILGRIDEAIEISRRNQRKSSSSSSAQRQRVEKRRSGRRQEQRAAQPGDARDGSDKQDTPSQGGADESGPSSDRPFAETRRTWGTLPDRDREAVIQGFKEDFLRKYAELIESYYRALSEEAQE